MKAGIAIINPPPPPSTYAFERSLLHIIGEKIILQIYFLFIYFIGSNVALHMHLTLTLSSAHVKFDV